MHGSAVIWQGAALPLKGDDRRLSRLLDTLWRDYFADVPRVNQLCVGFDYPWKRYLGRIRMTRDGQRSEIAFNSLLDHPEVPEAMLVAIAAHEIVHYAQGFGSPLPRAQRFAHAHGVVSRELAWRGLAEYEEALHHWVEKIWPNFEPVARAQLALRRASARTCVPVFEVVY